MTRLPARNTQHGPPTAAETHVETLSPRTQNAGLSGRASAMQAPMRNSELRFAASLMVPFSRLMRRLHALPAEELDKLDGIDPEEHIPISLVSELLRGAVVLTGDIDIGLKAAYFAHGDHSIRVMAIGQFGHRDRSGATRGWWLLLVGCVLSA